MNQPATIKRVMYAGVACFEHAEREPLHVHAEHGQLKWPTTGLARVRTPEGVFVVPPSRAVWIPAGQRHGGSYSSTVSEHSVYVHRDYTAALPQRAIAVVLSARLKAAIADAVARSGSYDDGSFAARDRETLAILDAEVRDRGFSALAITLPVESRLQPLYDALSLRPEDETNIADWAAHLHMSPSTLTRIFKHETGTSLGVWRKRARLLVALERLALGTGVTQVAAQLGYRSDSAFIYMFRRTLGVTPHRYFEVDFAS